MRMSLSPSPPKKGDCCISDGAGDGGSGDTDRSDGDRCAASTCISVLELWASGRDMVPYVAVVVTPAAAAVPRSQRRAGEGGHPR